MPRRNKTFDEMKDESQQGKSLRFAEAKKTLAKAKAFAEVNHTCDKVKHTCVKVKEAHLDL